MASLGLELRDLFPQDGDEFATAERHPCVASPNAAEIADWEIHHWETVEAECGRRIAPDFVEALAYELRVDSLALRDLGIGDSGGVYTFPEKDGNERIIGIATRSPLDGSKGFLRGGHRGLYLPGGWRSSRLPLLIVEGASDTAALRSFGLRAIGRPSATGGAKHLARALSGMTDGIVVVGENDRKPDGSWPGRKGAMKLARHLAHALQRSVKLTFPPKHFKDVRAWLGSTGAPRERVAIFEKLLRRGHTVKPSELTSLPASTVDGVSRDSDPATDVAAGRSTGLTRPVVREAADDPIRLARIAVMELAPIRWWRQDWYRWVTPVWRRVSDAEMAAEIWRISKAEIDSLAVGRKTTAIRVKRHLVADVLAAMQSLTILPDSARTPSWLKCSREWAAERCLLLRNGILPLDDESRTLLPPTPDLWSINALDFGFDANAQCPAWQQFVDALWPQDRESRECLQEIMGYIVSGRLDLEKMFLFVGPTRSGKGTIGRVTQQLLGSTNVAGPSLGDLCERFWGQSLLNAKLAIIGDARLGSRADSSRVVERLLSVSGRDTKTVDRKGKVPVECQLPTRFLVLTNEIPRLNDASGTIATRFVVLRFAQSWLGREDPRLKDRLLDELPGILNWSLRGLKRLEQRGAFRQPDSGAELLRDMQRLASPIRGFIDDRCLVGPEERISKAALYEAYQRWCRDRGYSMPSSDGTFGRDLRAAVPGVTDGRPGSGNSRMRMYFGIGLLVAHGLSDQ